MFFPFLSLHGERFHTANRSRWAFPGLPTSAKQMYVNVFMFMCKFFRAACFLLFSDVLCTNLISGCFYLPTLCSSDHSAQSYYNILRVQSCTR